MCPCFHLKEFHPEAMPIPMMDIIASMQKDKEKTETAIHRIQQYLQRNHSP